LNEVKRKSTLNVLTQIQKQKRSALEKVADLPPKNI
jgi:hypothetical protein